MKIGLVSPYDFAYPGGVTNHILHLRDEYVRRGHQVRIIAPSSVPAAAISDPDVIAIGRPWAVPANGSIARITLSLRLTHQVKTVLDRELFDVVHLHEPLMLTLPLTVLRVSQAVNVGTFHGFAERNLAYFSGRRMLRRWFKRLDGKIAVSRPAMQFASYYFPGYYNIIPNGIDLDRCSGAAAPFPEYQDGKFNILFLGRMEKRKGLKHLLRAYAQVKPLVPESRLIIVGDGGLRQQYEQSVAASGLQDVVFTGYVPDEDVPRYYRTADVFCAPATGGESFGIVLLEAMAGGTPIIASDIEGYASVLTHGQEGLLTPPKDETALAKAILAMHGDPEGRRRMGEAGRLNAPQYSWEHIATRLLAYYERLLNERAGSLPLPAPPHVGRTRRLLRLLPRWLRARPGADERPHNLAAP
ncbi:MAG: glycosyltransferase family 4 protein [Chloroflexi bacterium]|nr:glycosyltransferase family 4 protein [Chloroflexota bacterium]